MLIILLLSLSSIATFLLLTRTVWATRYYKDKTVKSSSQNQNLPTVSVCIAARNEMHALAHCLEAVLASDYPKLEILVLDDSSEDNTPLIIKSFAQAGIRFIAGSALPDGWLGKNHAYQTLLAESSGELVLYIDVDTTLSVRSISRVVDILLSSNVDMVSVLPQRTDGYRSSSIFGTLRYYLELLLGTHAKPPAASAFWMVRRSTVESVDFTFKNYALSVRPERHLAKQLQHLGRYKYLLSTTGIGVGYEKQIHSQYETAQRLYYPIVGRSIAGWLIATVLFLVFLWPYVVLLLPSVSTEVVMWALVTSLGIFVSLAIFNTATCGRHVWVIRTVFTPLLLIQELILMQVSFVQYALGRVTWKGRIVTANTKRHEALSIDE